MRNFKWMVTGLAVACIVALLTQVNKTPAQVTVAQVVAQDTLSLLFNPAYPVKRAAGYFVWSNVRGNGSHSVRPDTAAIHAKYGNRQKVWVATVSDTATSTTAASAMDYTFTIIDLSGPTRDTTITISDKFGIEILDLIPNVDMHVIQGDSLNIHDQVVIAWVTSTWQ